MAPAKKATEEGREGAERERLRTRAEGLVVQAPVPDGDGERIPRALLKSDGADIVKRNTTRKKRYIMMFPGGLQINPGARIGMLDGLSTKTPRLTIECGEGRILLKGFLTFPKNPLILIKGGSSRTAVKVVDCFDVAIVFSEWSWVGNKEGNPGEVPEPLPSHIIGNEGSVWTSSNKNTMEKADSLVTKSNLHGTIKVKDHDSLCDEPDSSTENIVHESITLNDDDDWGAQVGVKLKQSNYVRRRSNPSRKKRAIDYSQLEIEDDEDVENNEAVDLVDEESNDLDVKVKGKRGVDESLNFDDEIQIVSAELKTSVSGEDRLISPERKELHGRTSPSKGLKRKREHMLTPNGIVDADQDTLELSGTKKERVRRGVSSRAKRSRQIVDNTDDDSNDEELEPDFVADDAVQLKGLINKNEKVASRPKRRRSVVKYTQSSDEYSDVNDDNSTSDHEKTQTRPTTADSNGSNLRSARSKKESLTLLDDDLIENGFSEAED